jgi:hypothetical protein
VADVGTGDGSFLTRLEDRAVGPVAGEYVLDVRLHKGLRLQAHGSGVGEAGDLKQILEDLLGDGLVDRYRHSGA